MNAAEIVKGNIQCNRSFEVVQLFTPYEEAISDFRKAAAACWPRNAQGDCKSLPRVENAHNLVAGKLFLLPLPSFAHKGCRKYMVSPTPRLNSGLPVI